MILINNLLFNKIDSWNTNSFWIFHFICMFFIVLLSHFPIPFESNYRISQILTNWFVTRFRMIDAKNQNDLTTIWNNSFESYLVIVNKINSISQTIDNILLVDRIESNWFDEITLNIPECMQNYTKWQWIFEWFQLESNSKLEYTNIIDHQWSFGWHINYGYFCQKKNREKNQYANEFYI